MDSRQEISSLGSQLTYTFSANRNANYPFSLLYTSLDGKTLTRLEAVGNASYKRWANTEWWTDGYDALWSPKEGQVSQLTASKDTVVYLTADSDVELTELQPEETYILGGIVDRNRYKACPSLSLDLVTAL